MPTGNAVGIAPVIITVVPRAKGAIAALVLIRIGKRGRGDQGDGTSKEKTLQHEHTSPAVCQSNRFILGPEPGLNGAVQLSAAVRFGARPVFRYGAIEGAGFLRLRFGWWLMPAARRPTEAGAAALALWELR